MKRFPLALAGVLTLALALTPSAAAGQAGTIVRFLGGEAGVRADGSTTLANGVETLGHGLQEFWFRLPVAGALVDPRIFQFNLVTAPTIRRTTSYEADQSAWGWSGTLDFNGTLFSARRMPVNLFWTKAKGQNETGFGGTSFTSGSQLGFTTRYRSRYFPADMTYRRRRLNSRFESASAPRPFLRDEYNSQWRFRAGGRKLILRWEQDQYQEFVAGTGFSQRLLGAQHNLAWGKGSTLRSEFTSIKRTGFTAYNQWTWTETAQIQHTRRIVSGLGFKRHRARSGELGNTVTAIDYGLNGRITQWLESGLTVGRQGYRRDDQTGHSRLIIRPRIGFTFPLPLRSDLRISGSVTAERLNFDGGEGAPVEVSGEEHEVPRERTLELEERFAILPSVRIFDIDRTLLYEDGFDYRVTQVSGFTEVQILPSGRIQEGEFLVIDYAYQLAVEQSTRSIWGEYGVYLHVPGFSFSHGRSVREIRPLEDVSGILPLDFHDERWFQVSGSHYFPFGGVSLAASYRERSEFRHPFRSWEVRGGWSPPRLGPVGLSVNYSAGVTVNGSVGNGRRTRTLNTSMDWQVTRAIHFRGGMDAWSWSREDGTSPEEFLGGWGTLSWRWGATETRLRYDRNLRWLNLGGHRVESRWFLSVVRRF